MENSTKTLDQHIEVTPSIAGGKPRIGGHRITVHNIVVWHERMRKGGDEIAAEYDLTPAEVYAALAYYFDHRSEIDQSIENGKAFVEALRQSTPSCLCVARRQARLRQRLREPKMYGAED